MNTYLRLKTLFNATKFQTYIQQVQRVIENPQQFVNEQRTNNGANRNRPIVQKTLPQCSVMADTFGS